MISLRHLYFEFPRRFWIVVGVHFIDKIGGTIVFPFFALYITRKFSVGMTEAGVLLGLLSLAGMVGSVIGGALTDRLGRRKLILFGLVASALSALTLGSVNQFAWLFPAAALVGLFSEVGRARACRHDCRYPSKGSASGRLRHSSRGRQHGMARRPHGRRFRGALLLFRAVRHRRHDELHRRCALLLVHVGNEAGAARARPARRLPRDVQKLWNRAARQRVCRVSGCCRADGDGLHPDVQLSVGVSPR